MPVDDRRTYDTEGVEIVADAERILGGVVKERRKAKVRPYVLIDSREQRPLRFPPELGVDCGGATLQTGDYSVRGFTALIALERKSVPDLASSLTQGRERFENELDRLAEYRWKAILIEGDQCDIEGHAYRSNALPQSILGSLRAFYWKWGIPHFWCTNPAGAAAHVAWCARRLEEKHADLKETGNETPM